MDHKVPLSKVVLGMVRAAKGHKGPEWEEIAAVGCAVQVIISNPAKRIKKNICNHKIESVKYHMM